MTAGNTAAAGTSHDGAIRAVVAWTSRAITGKRRR
jgi:hypothetical protein